MILQQCGIYPDSEHVRQKYLQFVSVGSDSQGISMILGRPTVYLCVVLAYTPVSPRIPSIELHVPNQLYVEVSFEHSLH